MIVETGRFGQLTISSAEEIWIPQGVLGFPEYRKFCLVDPGDDTLILWLQSIENPNVVFPVLEPRVFKTDYTVRLSGAELRELNLANVSSAAVLSILTIPDNVTEMTANLKAPLVINLENQVGKQVVLQENEYSIKHSMFKELKTHLITIRNVMKNASNNKQVHQEMHGQQISASAIVVKSLEPATFVKPLHASL